MSSRDHFLGALVCRVVSLGRGERSESESRRKNKFEGGQLPSVRVCFVPPVWLSVCHSTVSWLAAPSLLHCLPSLPFSSSLPSFPSRPFPSCSPASPFRLLLVLSTVTLLLAIGRKCSKPVDRRAAACFHFCFFSPRESSAVQCSPVSPCVVWLCVALRTIVLLSGLFLVRGTKQVIRRPEAWNVRLIVVDRIEVGVRFGKQSVERTQQQLVERKE